jgi:ABC-type branched-subunit amino acid transport system ATPase component
MTRRRSEVIVDTDPGRPILEVQDVSVRFGGVQALQAVSLSARPATVTGLIGPNGAGKTTLFNVITGLEKPAAGRVSIGRVDVTALAPYRRARLGVARTFQRLEVFGSLSVRENVLTGAEFGSDRTRAECAKLADSILERVGLSGVAANRVDTLPTGMARLVELGRALASEPRLLLLDEPSSGLDEFETETFGDLLLQVSALGTAILLVEHDIDLVMRVCSDVHVLDFGRMVAHGTPEQVRANPEVQAAYLGVPAEEADAPVARVQAVRSDQADGPAGPELPPAVQMHELRAGYGRIEVLHDLSLLIRPGEVFALLGPNGAGKSTLLKVASGHVPVTGGCLHLGGVHVNGASPDALARTGVCLIPEGRGIFPNLTVAENMAMFAYAMKQPAGHLEERAFRYFPRLAERRTQLAGTLSGGEQQMLALSRTLLVDPVLLLLDEISMGLAPIVVSELYDFVGELAAGGITIVVTEQFADAALAIADRAAVMAQGRIAAVGPPRQIEGMVSDLYLGGAG